jgi:site-specific recombinase XerD
MPFTPACPRAYVSRVTIHTLRQSFVSRLVLAGVDLRTVQELGGCQRPAVAQGYRHLSLGHNGQAVKTRVKCPNAIHNAAQVASGEVL